MESLFLIGIIAIFTFLLVRWRFKKIFGSEDVLRIPLTWGATIIFTPLIFYALMMIYSLYATYYPSRDFNQAEWISDHENRFEMTDDLISSKILIGKTKDEVKKFLGDDFYLYDENHWGYDVGLVPRMFSVDPDILDIYFKDGHVEKVGQHES